MCVLSWLPRNLWSEVCSFSLVVVCSLVAAYRLCFWILVPSDWVKSLSRVRLFATPWTVAYQAPPSMGFSRQEYWSGLPFPSPGDLPNLGIEPGSPALHADALTSEPPGKPKNRDQTQVPALGGGFKTTKPPGNSLQYLTLYMGCSTIMTL